MNLARSFLFNLLCFLWSLVMFLLCLPLLAAPARAIMAAGRFWLRGVFLLLSGIGGIDYEERGRERLPPLPYLIAAKHQSAWETLYFPLALPNPVFVLKRELLWLPFFGWYIARAGMIAIDRAGKASALKKMLAAAKARFALGRPVVLFPEGTRSAPGCFRPYQPGIAALYGQIDVPIVPVALNSGLYWPRRSFAKRPGTILVEYLEPIPPGLDRRRFLDELQSRIETATRRLEIEAGGS